MIILTGRDGLSIARYPRLRMAPGQTDTHALRIHGRDCGGGGGEVACNWKPLPPTPSSANQIYVLPNPGYERSTCRTARNSAGDGSVVHGELEAADAFESLASEHELHWRRRVYPHPGARARVVPRLAVLNMARSEPAFAPGVDRPANYQLPDQRRVRSASTLLPGRPGRSTWTNLWTTVRAIGRPVTYHRAMPSGGFHHCAASESTSAALCGLFLAPCTEWRSPLSQYESGTVMPKP